MTAFSNPFEWTTYLLLVLPLLATAKLIGQYVLSSRLDTSALRQRVAGRHVVVTGGSKGLGKGIARVLVECGANVTLVARGKDSLDTARGELKAIHGAGRILVQPIDLASADKVAAGLKEIAKQGGKIDWLIHNAGSSVPGFVADQLNQEFESMVSQNMLSCANVVRGLVTNAKQLAEDKKLVPGARTWSISGLSASAQEEMPSKIVFVGSVASALSFIGYSAYAASKYGQRGFAEGLRSEFAPLGIDVHVYLPANMDTPGLVVEGETKPEITAQIEGTASTATPDHAARALLAGILNKRFLICNDILGELIRVSANGGSPRPNPLTEAIASPVVAFAFSIWSVMTDMEIASYFKQARKPVDKGSKKSD
ncbi:3-dehydrosphinganine reductase [Podochytrium sp. JEL0797]|nr:3-dehydrosphinganine reductase [Podochytrium sp. JEL0797]